MEWTISESLVLIIGVLFLSVLYILKCFFMNKKEDERSVGKEKMRNGGEERFAIPRGSLGWPLIGETLDFIASGYTSRPVSFMENRKSLYGDVFKTHILGKAIIVSTDPEVNKAILHNHGNMFVPSYPKSITELLGKSSILQMNGYLHKRMHSLIGVFLKSPQFKSRITKHIEKSVCHSLSTWRNGNCHVYLQEEAKKTTFEILVRVLLSVGPGEEMELLKREFEEYIKGLICLPIKFSGTRLYKSLKAKDRLLKMVKRIIEERKMAMANGEDKASPHDVIDVLIREHEELDEMHHHQLPVDFISGNIVEMMIPGEETVPTSITLAVKFLSDHPLALKHLVDENIELKERKANSGEEYSWTDYMSLPFTQNVINETLRLANIINAIWRKAVKDVKIKGYLIPKGWCVLASLSSVHMDERNYENPFEFDPWRWKNIGAAVSSNVFTPFGGGQRLCPGLELSRLEIAVFLHHFVTTYRWEAEKDEIIYFPTVRMKRKLPIAITPLHQSIAPAKN